MATKSEIKKQVKEFLKDTSRKKLELEVPSNFSIYWIRSRIGVWYRKFFDLIMSKTVPSHLKTWLYKIHGYDFGRDVCLPGFIFIDPYFPELIKLEPGVLVGGFAQIKPWKLEGNKLTLGRIHVKRRVLVSGWAKIAPGVTVGEKVILGLKSNAHEDVPENSFWVGDPGRVLKQWTPEEAERHFGESNHDPNYKKNVKMLTKDFRKDPNKTSIRFRNNGDRLNAGNDWWRARPVWRIFYNGIWVELSLLCPFEFLRKLFFKMAGVKFGKNVKLGKKVVFDHIYGDMVTIGDNVIIEDNVFFDGHEYTTTETVYGRTKIGNNVHLKKGSYVREGLTVGDNAILEENAVLLKDAAANETWAGAPAKLVQ